MSQNAHCVFVVDATLRNRWNLVEGYLAKIIALFGALYPNQKVDATVIAFGAHSSLQQYPYRVYPTQTLQEISLLLSTLCQTTSKVGFASLAQGLDVAILDALVAAAETLETNTTASAGRHILLLTSSDVGCLFEDDTIDVSEPSSSLNKLEKYDSVTFSSLAEIFVREEIKYSTITFKYLARVEQFQQLFTSKSNLPVSNLPLANQEHYVALLGLQSGSNKLKRPSDTVTSPTQVDHKRQRTESGADPNLLASIAAMAAQAPPSSSQPPLKTTPQPLAPNPSQMTAELIKALPPEQRMMALEARKAEQARMMDSVFAQLHEQVRVRKITEEKAKETQEAYRNRWKNELGGLDQAIANCKREIQQRNQNQPNPQVQDPASSQPTYDNTPPAWQGILTLTLPDSRTIKVHSVARPAKDQSLDRSSISATWPRAQIDLNQLILTKDFAALQAYVTEHKIPVLSFTPIPVAILQKMQPAVDPTTIANNELASATLRAALAARKGLSWVSIGPPSDNKGLVVLPLNNNVIAISFHQIPLPTHLLNPRPRPQPIAPAPPPLLPPQPLQPQFNQQMQPTPAQMMQQQQFQQQLQQFAASQNMTDPNAMFQNLTMQYSQLQQHQQQQQQQNPMQPPQ